jgi:hypothetical protein
MLARWVNPLRTIAARIPANHREMACEAHCSWDLTQYRSAIEAVAHPKCVCSIAAFSRHPSRCDPLMDRPAVLRWWCVDETCSAQWTICAPLRNLLPRC